VEHSTAVGSTAVSTRFVCAGTDPASDTSPAHQWVFCLTDRYVGCSRYRRAIAQPPAPDSAPPGASVRRGLIAAGTLALFGGAAALGAVLIGNPFEAEPGTAGSTSGALVAAAPTTPAAAPASKPIAASATAVVPTTTATPSSARPAGTSTPARTGTPAVQTYRVVAGDSLTSLAQRFRVSVGELAAANDLSPTADLLIDQMVRIPAAAPATSTPPSR
jgi:LysM repeat protein